MDISVVVPLFNEEESLPELMNWIDKVMAKNKYSYEVIFMNYLVGICTSPSKLISRNTQRPLLFDMNIYFICYHLYSILIECCIPVERVKSTVVKWPARSKLRQLECSTRQIYTQLFISVQHLYTALYINTKSINSSLYQCSIYTQLMYIYEVSINSSVYLCSIYKQLMYICEVSINSLCISVQYL